MLDKKAQVGETMTWVIATIVIIVILSISIYVAGASGVAEKVLSLGRAFEIKGHNDLLVTKSLTGYLLTNDGNGVVFGQIKDKKGIAGEVVSKPVVDLFREIVLLYEEEYPYHWIGIVTNDNVFDPVKGVNPTGTPPNSQFGFVGQRIGKSQGSEKFYYNQIELNKNVILELMLIKFTKS